MTSSKMSTMPCGRRARAAPSRKPGCGSTAPMLWGIGSTMIAATSPALLGERLLDLRRVVEAADDRGLDDVGEDAAAERIVPPDALGRRDDVHRDGVVPAVVAALELDHLAAAGRGARQAQRVERRLAARVREEHALDRRHDLGDLLRQHDLLLGDADAHEVDRARRLGERAVDVRVGVTEHGRAEGGVEVEVALAVGVREVRASGARDHEVLEPCDRPLRAGDPAGHHGARALVECCAARCHQGSLSSGAGGSSSTHSGKARFQFSWMIGSWTSSGIVGRRVPSTTSLTARRPSITLSIVADGKSEREQQLVRHAVLHGRDHRLPVAPRPVVHGGDVGVHVGALRMSATRSSSHGWPRCATIIRSPGSPSPGPRAQGSRPAQLARLRERGALVPDDRDAERWTRARRTASALGPSGRSAGRPGPSFSPRRPSLPTQCSSCSIAVGLVGVDRRPSR